MFRAPIYERDWRPSCIVRRSSSSSVASGARTAIRATTAVSSLLKLRLLVGEILTNSEDPYTHRRNRQFRVFHKFHPIFQNLASHAPCHDYDSRLCIPSLVDRLRVKNPNWLVEPRQGDYLFLLEDGNLTEKTVITRLLRTAALRLCGLDSIRRSWTHTA